jgi:hypothetical protein
VARDQYVNVRMTPEMKEALLRAARDEERTASAQARLVIREWLLTRGLLEPEDKKTKRRRR